MVRSLREAAKELRSLEENAHTMRQRLIGCERKLASVKKEVELLSGRAKDVDLSDHAVVRYFERVLGYDIDAVREAILPYRQRQEALVRGKRGHFKVKDPVTGVWSHEAIVADYTIVTVQRIAKEVPRSAPEFEDRGLEGVDW